MAIDKSNSPMWVKAVVIVVAAGFVLMVAGSSLSYMFTSQPASTGSSPAGSVNASDTLSAISKQFAPQTEAIEQRLATEPNNAELLRAQAEQYFGWANAILSATNSITEARPMAALSVQYYDRAFAVAPGDSGDLTDYAAALFYSGDLAKATATAEGVIAKDPKYAAAHFNLGVFYTAAGRNADAIKAYETALKLEPTGPEAEELSARIAALKQQPAPSTGATGGP